MACKTFQLVLPLPPNPPDFNWAAELVRRLILPSFASGCAGQSVSLEIDNNGTPLTGPIGILNFVDSDASPVSESPTGTAAVGLSQYALLAGRSGGQTLSGGSGSGEDLTLDATANVTKGSIGFFDKTKAAFSINGLGQERLIIGGNTDFSDVFTAGGLLQFIIENDKGNAIFGLWTTSDTADAPPQMSFFRSRGSFDSYTTTQQDDSLGEWIILGVDSGGSPAFAGTIKFNQDAPPISGGVPASMRFNTFASNSHVLHLQSDGTLSNVTNDLFNSYGWFIETPSASDPGIVIQSQTGQTADYVRVQDNSTPTPIILGKITAAALIDMLAYSVNGTAGIDATITTAALTTLGSQGSMTFNKGILTAQTAAT